MSEPATNSNNNTQTTGDVNVSSVDSTNLFAFNSNYSAFANASPNGGDPSDMQAVDLSQLSTQLLLSQMHAAAAASVGAGAAGGVAADSASPASGDLGSPSVHPSVPSLMQEFNPYFYLNNLNLNSLTGLPQGDMNGQPGDPLAMPGNINNALNQAAAGLGVMNYLSQPQRPMGGLSQPGMNINMGMMNMNPSICKFFASGHCARGEQCNYAHIAMNQPTGPPHHPGQIQHMGPINMNPKPHRSGRGGRGGDNNYYGNNGPRRDFNPNGPHHGNYQGGPSMGRGGRYANGQGRGSREANNGGGFNAMPPLGPGGAGGQQRGSGVFHVSSPSHAPQGHLPHPHHAPHSHHPHSHHPHHQPHHPHQPHQHHQPLHQPLQHPHHNQHPHSHPHQPPHPLGHPHQPPQHTIHMHNGQGTAPPGAFEDPAAAAAAAAGPFGQANNAFNNLLSQQQGKMAGMGPNFGLGLSGLGDNGLGLPGFLNPNMGPPNGAGPLGLNPNMALGLDPAAAAAAAAGFMNLNDPASYSAEAAAVQAAYFHAANNNMAAGVGGDVGLTATTEDLIGRVYSLAKDQYGCRLLQRLLDDGRVGVLDIVFAECFDHINDLMTDPFGNYLCQKLIEHCSDAQRLAILHKVAPDLVAISLNLHGTRAVQKLVETIATPPEVEILVNSLRASVVTLIKDLNGNHVIQRALHHLSSKDNQFIYDAVCRYCVSVATHKHGCCVLQRCIDYATAGQKRQLVAEIIASSLELVQDAFGNNVVQYVLDLGEPSTSNQIIANLLGHISSLSVQKFSSNVIEKCLELANDKMRGRVVDELVNLERLPRLLQDPYANYVIQKALSVSKKTHLDRLVQVIKPHLHALRNTSFGKRIQNKILKKFPDLDIGFGSGVFYDENGNPVQLASLPLADGADAGHLNEMQQLSDEMANQLNIQLQYSAGAAAPASGSTSHVPSQTSSPALASAPAPAVPADAAEPLDGAANAPAPTEGQTLHNA